MPHGKLGERHRQGRPMGSLLAFLRVNVLVLIFIRTSALMLTSVRADDRLSTSFRCNALRYRKLFNPFNQTLCTYLSLVSPTIGGTTMYPARARTLRGGARPRGR